MAFNFNKQLATISSTFKRDDESLHMKLNPNAMTGKQIREINDRMREIMSVQTGLEVLEAQNYATAKMLSLIIESWDDESAQPTFEFFDGLPTQLLTDLMAFCNSEINPKQKTATP